MVCKLLRTSVAILPQVRPYCNMADVDAASVISWQSFVSDANYEAGGVSSGMIIPDDTPPASPRLADAQNEDLEGMGTREWGLGTAVLLTEDLLAWGRRNGDLLTPSEKAAEQTLLRELDWQSKLAKSVAKGEKLRRSLQEKKIEKNGKKAILGRAGETEGSAAGSPKPKPASAGMGVGPWPTPPDRRMWQS